MTKKNKRQDCKNFIIRRFCGFFIIYDIIFYELFNILSYMNSYYLHTSRSFFILGIIPLFFAFPIFITFCFVTKFKHYDLAPSKITYLHIFLLIFSFVFSLIGIVPAVMILCLALSLKSTFRKRIFTKKE